MSAPDRLRERTSHALADWIGERPETVLTVAALLSGRGRAWIDGDPAAPAAALVESALVPGEPQGFGDADALMRLLAAADGWDCVEVESGLVEAMSAEFDRRWGLERTVIDVVHELHDPVEVSTHPLVRSLTPAEVRDLPAASPDLLPDGDLVAEAGARGRVFAAVDDGVIVGHGSSMAASRKYADVGVHVAEDYRGDGIATAAASLTCEQVQRAGLTPVWGAGSENDASLRVAEKLGFREVARLVFLVRRS